VVSWVLTGDLTELAINLSGGLKLTTLNPLDVGLSWTLFDRRWAHTTWLCVKDGSLIEEGSAGLARSQQDWGLGLLENGTFEDER
jgi:hypothetical protein